MTSDAVPTRRPLPVWVTVTIAGGMGLFYAFIVWNAVDLLVRQATGPLGLNTYGWFVHLAAVVFPLLAFGAAFAVGHRRRPGEFALVMLTGLALSAVFWVNIVAYGVVSFSLYGG
ncbi:MULTISPECIES: bacitracin resistance protein [unclassified Microbacterium]|uniref:bacitracin resistance protein n=1 Tax=unclassified Microbacterium TaxID=2609290 RepID=UPI003746E377